IQVVAISARNNSGLADLKEAVNNTTSIPTQTEGPDVHVLAPEVIDLVKEHIKTDNNYLALQLLHQHLPLNVFSASEHELFERIKKEYDFESSKLQAAETIARYRHLSSVLNGVVKDTGAARKFVFSDKLDA